jgi:hypothetical protein
MTLDANVVRCADLIATLDAAFCVYPSMSAGHNFAIIEAFPHGKGCTCVNRRCIASSWPRGPHVVST